MMTNHVKKITGLFQGWTVVVHLLATEVADNNEGILDQAGDQIHDGEGYFYAVHTVLDLSILEEGPEKHGVERDA